MAGLRLPSKLRNPAAVKRRMRPVAGARPAILQGPAPPLHTWPCQPNGRHCQFTPARVWALETSCPICPQPLLAHTSPRPWPGRREALPLLFEVTVGNVAVSWPTFLARTRVREGLYTPTISLCLGRDPSPSTSV